MQYGERKWTKGKEGGRGASVTFDARKEGVGWIEGENIEVVDKKKRGG